VAPGAAAQAGNGNQFAAPDQFERARINDSLSFDTFVTGKANQLARAAAMQVAENPGGSYNPLFLYGGVGLGKTHLVHAVGNAILARKPDARVRYIHRRAVRERRGARLSAKVVRRLQALLPLARPAADRRHPVLRRQERTQEEFFYAFEALVAGRKQIIITSDTLSEGTERHRGPAGVALLSGLIVSIEPPELEMRVAILLKKAELENFPLQEDVAFFIAKNLRSNVRELEGALRSILAYAQFHARTITVEVAREALRDVLSPQPARSRSS
jgi:chromosomal replication initiator protein